MPARKQPRTINVPGPGDYQSFIKPELHDATVRIFPRDNPRGRDFILHCLAFTPGAFSTCGRIYVRKHTAEIKTGIDPRTGQPITEKTTFSGQFDVFILNAPHSLDSGFKKQIPDHQFSLIFPGDKRIQRCAGRKSPRNLYTTGKRKTFAYI